MATQKDIARILKISQQTVSACFGSGSGTVKPSAKTRSQVLKVAREIGYIPNRMARSLKSGKSRTLGAILPFCKDPYYSCLIDALSLEALKHDFALDFRFHFWSKAEEQNAFKRLLEAKVEGILIFPRSIAASQVGGDDCWEQSPVPIVALSAKDQRHRYKAVIEKDYLLEGKLVGEHLLRLGHRKIDLLQAGTPDDVSRKKMEGLQQAIQESNTTATVNFTAFPAGILQAFHPQAPASLVERDAMIATMVKFYLSSGSRGTAVLVGNEAVAWKLMAESARLGVRVPESLSVVSSGLLGQGDTGPLPLTSAEYDPDEIAREAIQALIADCGANLTIKPMMMVRHSSSFCSENQSFSTNRGEQEHLDRLSGNGSAA